MEHELDLLELAAAWRSEGRRVALATVVAIWGSSPCPPGSQLLADDSGRFMGSVSGGCIEGEVVRRALEVIETDEPELLEFGIANEDAWSVGTQLRRPDPGFCRASRSNEIRRPILNSQGQEGEGSYRPADTASHRRADRRRAGVSAR